MTLDLKLPDESATRRLGEVLAATMPPLADEAVVVTLAGELGAGKTSLARAWLRALGVQGTVRSPTYTLVEPYETSRGAVHHLDLYRLSGTGGLERVGWRELRSGPGLILLEWPERAAGALGPVDLAIVLSHEGAGRQCRLEAGQERGAGWLGTLQNVT